MVVLGRCSNAVSIIGGVELVAVRSIMEVKRTIVRRGQNVAEGLFCRKKCSKTIIYYFSLKLALTPIEIRRSIDTSPLRKLQMSRHPLNLSTDARSARNPKTVQLIQMINQAAISPAIDLDDLADIPALAFSDRYEALAIMRHACRIIADGPVYSFVLVTRASQICVAQFDRCRGETQDECDAILRRMASAYSAYCNDNGVAIESLDVLVMPLATYQSHDGSSADSYGVSVGTFQDQDLRALNQI